MQLIFNTLQSITSRRNLKKRMQEFVAILRGINVGGKRKLKMADLRSLFEKLDFSHVSTYIQSGNVFFTYSGSKDRHFLMREIQDAIYNEFRYEVPVLLRSALELSRIVDLNPFYQSEDDVPRLHLTFLSDIPSRESIEKIQSKETGSDRYRIEDDHVFLYCEGKYHKSKLSNSFFEKHLQLRATTRNWKTVRKLVEKLS